jgi:hypothetical protein
MATIDIDTAAVRAVATAFRDAAQRYHSDWTRLHANITAIEAEVGAPVFGDTLSAEFRDQYNPVAEQLVKAQYDAGAGLQSSADAGNAAVDELEVTEDQVNRTVGAPSGPSAGVGSGA